MTSENRRDPREITRRAFRQAFGDVEPDVGRLVDAVPEMMAEARRRRELLQQRVDWLTVVTPLAKRAILPLAAAAAALVFTATVAGLRDTTSSVSETASLDTLLITGEVSQDVSDILLEAMVDTGNDNG
ncbi:MAG: hypothetical protein JSV80_08800 [Acidobacteriota bacterium]|nr:MAG: hypothetical protein JSV80_08800 [Acidobacteriota bacterium]